MVKIEFAPLSLDRKMFPFKKGFYKIVSFQELGQKRKRVVKIEFTPLSLPSPDRKIVPFKKCFKKFCGQESERHDASAPTILCTLERSSIEVVCLTRNSYSDGLIFNSIKNTISDKNIWYWINFGAFFDQNDIITRAKSLTLRIFPGKPGGHSNCRFLHRS